MTVINLVTKDQQLALASKPLLASGDINSVVLHVLFDSAWDDYIAKTAVFHTSTDRTEYEKLLTGGECPIPDEVLTEAGTLFIAVRGVPVDGSAVKTSEYVKYKIVKGASPGTYTIQVTPDIYQQYIEAMKQQLDPVSQYVKEQTDEAIAIMHHTFDDRIRVGTYPGEGVSGVDAWVSLDLGRKIQFIMIQGEDDVRLHLMHGQTKTWSHEESTSASIRVEWTDTGVRWKSTSATGFNQHYELNTQGETYYYFAVLA